MHRAAGKSNGTRRVAFEQLEGRRCLSTVAFGLNNIDCCAISTPSFGSGATTADVDGDGDLDVITASDYGVHRIAWYEYTDGKGNFGFERLIAKQFATSVAAGDMDNDGDLDVITDGTIGKQIGWYENIDGKGSFGHERVIGAPIGWVTSRLVAADLDRDGDADVIASATPTRTTWGGPIGVAWYENIDGRGESFSPARMISPESDIGVPTDVDGDGYLDIVSSGAWYRNTDGKANFERQPVSDDEMIRVVTTADVDRDGDTDLISASMNGIAWLENSDGQGHFTTHSVERGITLPDPYNATVGDMDSDGDVDIVSIVFNFQGDGYETQTVWYENTDGAGRFGPRQVISEVQAHTVATADMDHDGDPDVLLASSASASWFENMDAKGNFGPRQAITREVDWFRSVKAADMDGDADLDVLLSNSRTIDWYENTDGKGTFGPRKVISTQPVWSQSADAVDVDGDGDLDVLSASSAYNWGFAISDFKINF